jgi:D-threo-aldose 1-dehydrogenase
MSLPLLQVGHTTLQVPLLGFGTAPLATGVGWRNADVIPESQAIKTVLYAFEREVRWFDTAPYYGKGQAELRLGQVLTQLPRDQYILTTKIGADISGREITRDYSRDGVRRSLEGSLKRLQVDYVDALYIHDPDHHYHAALNEAFPALAELREQGVIKAIGVGMNQWQMLYEFAHHADFDCFLLAGRYTLLEQNAWPLLEVCQAKGIAVFAGSIYNSGILATGATQHATYNHALAPAEIMARVATLEAVCAAHHVALHVAATQFPLAHPAVRAIIVGFQTPTEVQACLAALHQPIPVAFWEQLRHEGFIAPALPLPNSKLIQS